MRLTEAERTDPRPRACQQRGCTIRCWYDIPTMRRVFQHGDNPEAVMFVGDDELLALPRSPYVTLDTMWWCYLLNRLIHWTDDIHRYEDADPRRHGREERRDGWKTSKRA